MGLAGGLAHLDLAALDRQPARTIGSAEEKASRHRTANNDAEDDADLDSTMPKRPSHLSAPTQVPNRQSLSAGAA